MPSNIVVVHALKLHEGSARIPNGNFYHLLFLLPSLSIECEKWNIRLAVLVDENGYEEFSKVVDNSLLINVGPMKGALVNDVRVCRIIEKLRPGIYHRPTGQLPPVTLPCRTICGIADLNFRWLPCSIPKRIYKEVSYLWSLTLADAVVCVSRFTLSDVAEKFWASKSNLTVVHHGSMRTVAKKAALESSLNALSVAAEGCFWITFGHQAHKNVEAALHALALFEINSRPHLIVIGACPHIDTVLRPLSVKLGVDRQVKFAGRLDDSILNDLYAKAQGLLFLSRFEGFGMPVLEAMAVGCPVVASTSTSLPEVAGDAALLVSGDDYHAVAEAMAKVQNSPNFRTHLKELGHIRSKHFTWEAAARKTVELYVSLLERPAII